MADQDEIEKAQLELKEQLRKRMMGGLKLNEHGVPLRGDGTPFPDDPSQWSHEEGEFLKEHYFKGITELPPETHVDDMTIVEVNEIHEEGEA